LKAVKHSVFQDEAENEVKQDQAGADPQYFKLKEMENQISFGRNEI